MPKYEINTPNVLGVVTTLLTLSGLDSEKKDVPFTELKNSGWVSQVFTEEQLKEAMNMIHMAGIVSIITLEDETVIYRLTAFKDFDIKQYDTKE